MGKTAAVDGSATDQQAKGVGSKRSYRLWVVAGVVGVLFIGVVGGVGQYGLSHHPSSLNAISDTTLSGMRYGGFIGGGVVFVGSVVAYFDVDKKLKKLLSIQSPSIDSNNDKANGASSKVAGERVAVDHADNEVDTPLAQTEAVQNEGAGSASTYEVDVVVFTPAGPLTHEGTNAAHYGLMIPSLQQLPATARMWRIATPQEHLPFHKGGCRPVRAGLPHCVQPLEDSPVTLFNLFTIDLFNPSNIEDLILLCLRDIPAEENVNGPQLWNGVTSSIVPIRDYSFKPCSAEEIPQNFSRMQFLDAQCMVVESAPKYRDGNKVNLYKIIRNKDGIIEKLDNLELEEARGMIYHLVKLNGHGFTYNDTSEKLDLSFLNSK